MMERREVLVAGAGGIAAVLLATRDSAAAEPGVGATSAKADGLAQAAGTCVVVGSACLQHCLTLLAQGDKSMGDCAKAVTQMRAVCDAMSTLAAYNSAYVPRLAKVCIDVCGDCEKACRPHAEQHAVCRACADSCAATIAQAKLVAA